MPPSALAFSLVVCEFLFSVQLFNLVLWPGGFSSNGCTYLAVKILVETSLHCQHSAGSEWFCRVSSEFNTSKFLSPQPPSSPRVTWVFQKSPPRSPACRHSVRAQLEPSSVWAFCGCTSSPGLCGLCLTAHLAANVWLLGWDGSWESLTALYRVEQPWIQLCLLPVLQGTLLLCSPSCPPPLLWWACFQWCCGLLVFGLLISSANVFLPL